MKRLYIFLGLLLMSGFTFAQTVDDALKFSQQNYSGTARSTAMGGAFGALGGDFSSLSINPAGIAIYRSSEFTITPSFQMNKSENGSFSEDKNKFRIGNIGYISSYVPRVDSGKGWQNFNFGIGYNQVANFDSKSFILNAASASSRLDFWSDVSSGSESNNLYLFEEKLAYDNFLINPDENLEYTSVLAGSDIMDQEKYTVEKGYISEFVLSFGGNYSHKLYLGATIGIQDLYYKTSTIYSEYAYNDNLSSLNEFTFGEDRVVDGVGANIKLGAIYKATQNLRLGLAVHTPTWYNLDTEMETFMNSDFDPSISNGFPEDGIASHSFLSEVIEYTNTDFKTPWRTILSGAYTFGKRAVISVDYEMLNYGKAKYSDGETEWDDGEYIEGFKTDLKGVNKAVSAIHESTANIRIGAEFRATPNISLRGGFAHIGDPYKGDYDEGYNTYSGGLGFKFNNFFLDTAAEYKNYNQDFVFYDGSDVVRLEKTNLNLKMTLGLRF